MKNKPDPALLEGSYLFNEIKKRTPKSRETIPLRPVSEQKLIKQYPLQLYILLSTVPISRNF
jgi:hypothetical protein